MGVGLEQWRAVVGCNMRPVRRLGFKPSAILVSRRSTMLCLKLCLVTLLLCCGDVEPNPGPPRLAPTRRQTRQTTLSQSGEVVDMAGDVKELKEAVKELQDEVADLRSDNRRLRKKVVNLEDQSRRDNLLFNGVAEADGDGKENWADCEEKVKGFVRDTLGVEEEVDIERAHRLGRKRRSLEGATAPDQTAAAAGDGGAAANENGNVNNNTGSQEGEEGGQQAQARPRRHSRPIIVKFHSWKTRQKVLEAARKLGKKPDPARPMNGVRVNEDFSEEVRDARRKLFPHLMQFKEANPDKIAFLRDPPPTMTRETA